MEQKPETTTDSEDVVTLSHGIDDLCSKHNVGVVLSSLLTVLAWGIADLADHDPDKAKVILDKINEDILFAVEEVIKSRKNRKEIKH